MYRALLVTVFVLPAACAHPRQAMQAPPAQGVVLERAASEEVVEIAEPAPCRPDAAYDRIARYDARPVPSGEMVEIPIAPNGTTYQELFAIVVRETGVRIRYEPQNAIVKHMRPSFVGPVRVPRDDLIAWFQDTCLVDGLVALQHGPADRHEMVVLDTATFSGLARLRGVECARQWAEGFHADKLMLVAGAASGQET